MSKKTLILSIIILILCFGVYKFANASSYVPLTPIPNLTSNIQTGTEDGKSSLGFAGYLKALYVWGVAAASGLAVVMIMWGGVEYMTSAGGGGVEEAKKRISSAIAGLLLALGSYIILYTINRDLLNLQFTIGRVNTTVNPNAAAKFVPVPVATSPSNYTGGFMGPLQDVSVGGNPSSVYRYAQNKNGNPTYDGQVFRANLIALDTDGTGNPGVDNERTADGRPQHQNQTSYQINGQSLNSITDDYVAMPTSMLKKYGGPLEAGDPVLITDNTTGQTLRAIVGDFGASGIGEMSVSAATKLGLWGPGTGHTGNSIDQSHDITITLGK